MAQGYVTTLPFNEASRTFFIVVGIRSPEEIFP